MTIVRLKKVLRFSPVDVVYVCCCDDDGGMKNVVGKGGRVIVCNVGKKAVLSKRRREI